MGENYQSRTERRRKLGADKKNQKGKKKGLFKKVVVLLLILAFAGLAAGAGTFAWYVKDVPKLDKQLLVDPVASELLDINGEVFTTLGAERRDYVEIDDIPKQVKDAVLATEDVRFYKHHGIDVKRLAGAVLANFSRGFGSEGASTLTQQVVKRSFLSDEKTLKRKAQEAWLSIQLENNYTKDQIFEMYVNKIYYSNGIHGIETASKFYFDKTLDELELQEAAFLAGLPQSPNNYNPYKHLEKADKRKNIVLSLMYQHGKISKEQMEKAKNISVGKTLVPQEKNQNESYKYDSFVDQVIREVEEMGDYNVFADGLKIYTTLDPDAQQYTEKMLFTDEVVQYPDEKFQAGIVLLDTKSGEVRAIGGSRNQDVKRGRNFATQLKDKTPGSTAKPIFDYGPAIEYLNWSTYEQIVDEPYTYTGGTPINNFDRSHLGQMSIREALYRSRNIPALKAFQEVGQENVKEFAERLGLDDPKIVESDAIGGGEQHPSPMTLAGAYAAFGNNGMYNKPHTVKKIVLMDGETEIKNKVEPEVAMKDSTAYMVTDMLKDVLSGKSGATGGAAAIPGLPVAGKTGTTNYSKEDILKYNIPDGSSPDSWFAGYTTNYTIAVWTGYEERKNPVLPKDLTIAQHLFKNLMTHVSADVQTPDFTMPKSVVRAAVEKGSNPAKKPSKYTPESNIVYELFVAGTEPTEVSQAYDKLDAPSVSGEYKEDGNQVVFSWSHPDMDKNDMKFEVKVNLGGGKQKDIGTTSDTSYTINEVEPGETYGIQVVAVAGSQRSAPGSASVTVPSQEDEEDEEDVQDEDEDSENQDGQEDQGDEQQNDQDQNQNDDKQNDNNGQQPGNNGNDGNGNPGNVNPGNGNNGNDQENPDNPDSPADTNPEGRRENN
ncbi:PBP1A family penicillin-binding protein [Siminovitchia fortis]|uniref:PBP1A family penicillin-binding protein n=1 Tax=Siminovitchia fortis TaxID=254758 RepID=A0A443IS46_9BACI|nr:penicillin-binding protein 1A [Siminovitchia fortis]RWR10411.1 PBP1A family penicillin-binding protein [Siminovitchia fortis]WHY82913.1 PBP1A family penicillin-binding protein [Siminovitchia fortis]